MGWVPDDDGEHRSEVPGAEAQRALRAATARCRELAAQIAILQAELVDAASAVVDLDGFLGGVTPAAHLAAECQLTGAEARRIVSLARQLEGLPKIRSAFDEGRLSEGTTVSLASVATAANEGELLHTAANANATQLQRLVRNYRMVKDNLDDADGRPPDERLSYGVRRDGMWHISGRARPERGAEIEAALRAMEEVDADCLIAPGEVHRLSGRSRPDNLFAGGSLDESVELDDRGNPIRPTDRGPVPVDEPPPIDVRQADVRPPGAMERLVRLAQSMLAGTVTAAGVLPDRFLTVVHVDDHRSPPDEPVAAGTDDSAHPPPRPTLHGGGIVEPDDLPEMLCGSWFAAVLSEHGRPVTGTHPRRDPPPAMRVALLARDKGCRFCGAAHFLHPHHIRWVSHRGRTTLSNLILLCGTCHRRLHTQGWRIEGDPNARPGATGSVRFLRRDGSEIPVRSLRRHTSRKQPPPTPGDDVVADRSSHNDQRLDRFASDVVVDHWLDPPGAA
jgi:hypothetical protein